VALGLLFVAGREIDAERPDVRVAERIALERLALHLGVLEAAA
jgi:hypothetical protein